MPPDPVLYAIVFEPAKGCGPSYAMHLGQLPRDPGQVRIRMITKHLQLGARWEIFLGIIAHILEAFFYFQITTRPNILDLLELMHVLKRESFGPGPQRGQEATVRCHFDLATICARRGQNLVLGRVLYHGEQLFDHHA